MANTQLIDLIYPQNKIVSIVGTSKNAGKTVTLNEIISQAQSKGIRLGLVSTGREKMCLPKLKSLLFLLAAAQY